MVEGAVKRSPDALGREPDALGREVDGWGSDCDALSGSKGSSDLHLLPQRDRISEVQ